MKLTFRLTLDGMVRALRLKAHALADRLDEGARPDADPSGTEMRARRNGPKRRETDHDSRRA